MRNLDDIHMEAIAPRKLQLGCLVFVGLIQLVILFFGPLVDGPMRTYVIIDMSIAGLFFLGLTIRQPLSRTAKKLLFSGMAFCGWVLLLQFSDYIHFQTTAYYGARFIYSGFLCEYLMLLPWAAAVDEQRKDTGLRAMGLIFLVISASYCVFGVMTVAGRPPHLFDRFMGWAGPRMGLQFHPNVTAFIYLVGVIFSMAFLFLTRRRWLQVLLGISIIPQFLLMSLTNARTVLLLCGCLFGGTHFFSVYTAGTEKDNWKRFLLGLAAAAVCIVAIYKISDWICAANASWMAKRGIEMGQLQLEDAAIMQSGQREFSYGLLSLNGRTEIWAGMLQGIKEHPEVLIGGVKNPGAFISRYYLDGVAHAHNGWFETLLRLGLVGFGFALYFTCLAVKNAILIMFFRRTTMFQKVIAMLSICILCNEVLEPHLFYVECPFCFVNILFLLSLGYLVHWAEQTEKLKPLQK